ncbi:SLAP domain-containing protein [Lactobacillus amylovorus]|uniref:SLAP domain-containing protein n=1 Tax=Lactobacillus amylovorus TaxID=1604 RepID=UPI00232F84D7|nr:SLAP domain-containing protein [Lactobacillus amylovorus]MDB6266408.1 SLAP domain-containing protein [Lactobacillus amylovorus]
MSFTAGTKVTPKTDGQTSSDSKGDKPAQSGKTDDKTPTTPAAKPVVRVTKRSYVYTKSGKIAKKNGKRVVLKKSSTRSLSNAKLVTIKGQKYYQIGRNQYVKASSVIAPIKKANVKATVKGRKNAKVRAYTPTAQLPFRQKELQVHCKAQHQRQDLLQGFRQELMDSSKQIKH